MIYFDCRVCVLQHVDLARCAYISESSDAAVVEVGSSAHGKHKVPCSNMHRNESALGYDTEMDTSVGRRKVHSGAVLGVKLMWTAAKHRRQRVAQRLLDAARKSMVYGTVVQVESIAFSQPTEDGLAFAQAYCRRKRILAYA